MKSTKRLLQSLKEKDLKEFQDEVLKDLDAAVLTAGIYLSLLAIATSLALSDFYSSIKNKK